MTENFKLPQPSRRPQQRAPKEAATAPAVAMPEKAARVEPPLVEARHGWPDSPEAAACALLALIMREDPAVRRDRKAVLDLYAECLAAANGEREKNEPPGFLN